MKTLLLTATYLVGIGELLLAIFFWVTHSKSEIRKVMALLALSTGVWAISNAVASYANPNTWVNINLHIAFIAGTFITYFLLYFSLLFPYQKVVLDKLHKLLLAAPAFIFSIIVLFPNLVISAYYVAPDNVGIVEKGPLFILYSMLISAYFFFAIRFLFYRYNRLDGIHKSNTKIVISGVLFGGLPGIISALLYSTIGVTINPLVIVIFSFFWVASTSYILLRK